MLPLGLMTKGCSPLVASLVVMVLEFQAARNQAHTGKPFETYCTPAHSLASWLLPKGKLAPARLGLHVHAPGNALIMCKLVLNPNYLCNGSWLHLLHRALPNAMPAL